MKKKLGLSKRKPPSPKAPSVEVTEKVKQELFAFTPDPSMALPDAPVKRIGVFALKGELTPAIAILRAFAEDHKNVKVYLCPYLKGFGDKRLLIKKESFLKSHVDIILSLGGDGTFLSAARLVRGEHTAILGVNLGRLGFMADATLENLRRILEEIMKNDYTLRRRMLLKVEAYHGRRRLFQDIALNEVAFTGVMGRQMVEMSVTANGKFVSDYRVDGLLVSTPTGSTAYNLSAGGPIVHPSTNALLLTPMNPGSLSVRPLVVADTISLEVRNTMVAGEELHVHVDGRNRGTLPPGAELRIQRNDQGIRIIRPTGSSYFGSLRNKLGWTGSRDGRR